MRVSRAAARRQARRGAAAQLAAGQSLLQAGQRGGHRTQPVVAGAAAYRLPTLTAVSAVIAGSLGGDVEAEIDTALADPDPRPATGRVSTPLGGSASGRRAARSTHGSVGHGQVHTRTGVHTVRGEVQLAAVFGRKEQPRRCPAVVRSRHRDAHTAHGSAPPPKRAAAGPARRGGVRHWERGGETSEVRAGAGRATRHNVDFACVGGQ
eukprot:2683732-Prymnesium_polylepis.1